MKTSGLLFGSLLLIAACSEPTPEPFVKQTKEVMHPTGSLFRMDSSGYVGKGSFNFSLALEPIPNHFVMLEMETDSFYEAHYFQDLHLVLQSDGDSFVINKDSLLPFVNKEYLNEALIEEVHLTDFSPDFKYYLFEFSVRKPHEDFRFHFIGSLENKKLQLTIDDE